MGQCILKKAVCYFTKFLGQMPPEELIIGLPEGGQSSGRNWTPGFSKHWPLVLPVPGEFILLAHPPPKVALPVPDVRSQACKAAYSMSCLHCCDFS